MTEESNLTHSPQQQEQAEDSQVRRDYLLLLMLSILLWALHAVWLLRDTRPPVWDMALHQSYALNYLPQMRTPTLTHYWELSGNYPPFVHLAIALAYLLFHPGPHPAVLANLPATLLLFWAVYGLGRRVAGPGAGRWACIITALTPYLIWMSRETVLDYWLSAWVALSLLLLLETRDFESHPRSLLFGCACAVGLLTKWTLAGFLVLPVAYICVRSRIWKSRERMIHFADAGLVTAGLAAFWYVPNLPRLVPYFAENARIGAREGEPPILSFQSFIYYLRLLEGYQLFGLLFLLLALSSFFAWKKGLFRDGRFWVVSIAGGWIAMTLLRTKDPRFTMPLLGPLAIASGAWVHSWGPALRSRLAQTALVVVLCFQACVINFGIRWLPQGVVLLKGYQGSLRWDWNLYLQDYFRILGAPRREDWQQEAILRRVAQDASRRGLRPVLALIPDLARFNEANFQLVARLHKLAVRIGHPQAVTGGVASFDGYDYVVMTEGDQGMPWTVSASLSLNKIVVDEHDTFLLLGLYPLPDGNSARLYYVRRGESAGG